MQLTAEEKFALRMIFRGLDAISTAVRVQVDTMKVTDRKMTGVGFFTTIHLMMALNNITQYQWDWNFEHKALNYGGSFMCWFDGVNVIELEAVTFDGNWPSYFDQNDFKEMP
jgi:hypothetical protein